MSGKRKGGFKLRILLFIYFTMKIEVYIFKKFVWQMFLEDIKDKLTSKQLEELEKEKELTIWNIDITI